MTGPVSYTAMNENGVVSPAEKNGKIPTCHTVVPGTGEPEEDNEEMCGWGSIQPKICQRFRQPKWVLFWLSLAGAVQGMVVNGFVNVVISNIERRYDLSSTESGTIASCYDIASVLCLIPISYFGGLGQKPRYLGIGVLVIGIGSFVFGLPHFLSGKYDYVTTHNVCSGNPVNGSSLLTCTAETPSNSLSQYKYMFFFGQLLHGAGASPLYTLGVTYLDENLSVRTSPVYIGIFYTMAIIGPAFGYLLGGKFLGLYVDINNVDTSTIGMKSGDAKFVGAWWIGFLMSGMIAIIISLPMCGFPRELPGATKYRMEREAEVYHRENSEDEADGRLADNNFKLGWKAIIHSVKILTSNPTFMFLNLAAACEGILLSGFATFAPKFIESQFSLSASESAVYVGYVVVPAGGGGTFLGGVLVRMLKLRVRGIIRMCLILSVILVPLLLIFLLRCQENRFVGISVPYNASDRRATPFLVGNLNAECNMNCHCTDGDFDPVCGTDGSVYFSPCHAGCKTVVPGPHKRYQNCSCIQTNNATHMDFMAESGKCPTQCSKLNLFMPIFAIVMLVTFIISMPALTATLRCVPQKQRSFGLGIQWIVARCLGSIPGPIMFGKMIDFTCRLWQRTCSDAGSCHFYDNELMGVYLMALTLVVKALSSFFFFLALVMYKAAPTRNRVNIASDSTSSALSTFSHRTSKQDSSVQNCLEDVDEQCERTLMEDNPPQS